MRSERIPPEDPPCDTCMVVLMDENRDAGTIFQVCRSQVIVAPMGGIVDIDIATVIKIMDLYEIRNKKTCLEKVRKLHRICEQNRKLKDENCGVES